MVCCDEPDKDKKIDVYLRPAKTVILCEKHDIYHNISEYCPKCFLDRKEFVNRKPHKRIDGINQEITLSEIRRATFKTKEGGE